MLDQWLIVGISFIPLTLFVLSVVGLVKSRDFLGRKKFVKWIFVVASFMFWDIVAIASLINIIANNFQTNLIGAFIRYTILLIAPFIGSIATLTLIRQYYCDFKKRLGQ